MKELERTDFSHNCYDDNVQIRLLEIDGHKYIVGSIASCSRHGAGASLTILHAESCPCKEKKSNEL